MAYGKIKADAFIYDDGGSDTEITAATIASNSSKANTASPTFTGTVTLPATTALAGQASDVTIIDNNAAALEVKEGSNAYVTFDTTNSSEQIEVAKKVQLAEDLEFSAAKDIIIPDNQAAGLEIKQGSLAYLAFDTTNSAEQVEANVPVVLHANNELRLADADSSNHVALKAPTTVASNVTLVLPADDGDADQYLQTNGSGVLSWATVTTSTGNDRAFASGSMSGSEVVITGIPSNAVKIDVLFRGVKTSGNGEFWFRVGNSSGVHETGYEIMSGTQGARARYTTKARLYHGFGSSGNTYQGNICLNYYDGTHFEMSGDGVETSSTGTQFWWSGIVDAGGTLDRVALMPGAGTWTAGTYIVHVYTE